jgi:hypothetical protein
MDPTRGLIGEWRDVAFFAELPGAEVIYTYDSNIDYPSTEGKPVGVAYETANGRRVVLGFPVYQMTPASATAMLAKVIEYFGGVTQYDKGDLDHSGRIDIGDISLLIDHLFIDQQPLLYPDEADVDGRLGVSIGDAYYLIRYIFLGGPAPVPQEG